MVISQQGSEAMNEIIARHTYTSTGIDSDTATIADLVKWLSDSPIPHDRKAADALAASKGRMK